MVMTAAVGAVHQGREEREASSMQLQRNVSQPGLLLQDKPFCLKEQQRSSDMPAASLALTVSPTPTWGQINKKLKHSQQFSTQSRMGLFGRVAGFFSHLYVQFEKLCGSSDPLSLGLKHPPWQSFVLPVPKTHTD